MFKYHISSCGAMEAHQTSNLGVLGSSPSKSVNNFFLIYFFIFYKFFLNNINNRPSKLYHLLISKIWNYLYKTIVEFSLSFLFVQIKSKDSNKNLNLYHQLKIRVNDVIIISVKRWINYLLYVSKWEFYIYWLNN